MEEVQVFKVEKSVGFTKEAFTLLDGSVDWSGIHLYIAELEAKVEQLKTYRRNAKRSARNLQAAYERMARREPKGALGYFALGLLGSAIFLGAALAGVGIVTLVLR